MASHLSAEGECDWTAQVACMLGCQPLLGSLLVTFPNGSRCAVSVTKLVSAAAAQWGKDKVLSQTCQDSASQPTENRTALHASACCMVTKQTVAGRGSVQHSACCSGSHHDSVQGNDHCVATAVLPLLPLPAAGMLAVLQAESVLQPPQ